MKVQSHIPINPNSRYTIEDKVYKEFDIDSKKLLFTLKLKHVKTVRFELSDTGMVIEYDEFGRVTYHKDANGYWSLLFYPDAGYEKMPYEVVHKYWDLYN